MVFGNRAVSERERRRHPKLATVAALNAIGRSATLRIDLSEAPLDEQRRISQQIAMVYAMYFSGYGWSPGKNTNAGEIEPMDVLLSSFCSSMSRSDSSITIKDRMSSTIEELPGDRKSTASVLFVAAVTVQDACVQWADYEGSEWIALVPSRVKQEVLETH